MVSSSVLRKGSLFLAGFLAVLVVLSSSGLVTGADNAPAGNMVVSVDAGKVGEPISKYIYGQFIEHLGRCIYGGIWAEMLEDRKFYYPVPSDGPVWKEEKGARVLCASPWQVVGPNDAVRMVKENAYVGSHTPEIQPSGDGTARGIFQGELALVAGKEYVGRVVLAGDSQVIAVEVSLVWGPQAGDRQTVTIEKIGREYAKAAFSFRAGKSTDNGRLEIVGRGKGKFRIGTVSLMPADNVRGMRSDTLKLLKELNSPIYRWPGGNFVSGYDWRDGLGDPDRRPPRKNPAWTGVEHNDFGLDEFIIFCNEAGAEALVVVNSGFGDHHSAAEEVEYANGSADTSMGKWRAANGHARPYGVKWWGIGNEMYGKWQLGYMQLSHYVQKHNLFAEAMRKVDPSIKLVAVGEVGKWSEGMLRDCADSMDLISEHFYKGAKESVVEHVQQMSKAVISKVEPHKKWRLELPTLKGKDIRIALDEWNYWHRPYVAEFGELGCRYTLKDALGIAVGLHEMIRNSDMIFMANYAQTVNVIGCIKTTKTEAGFATTGLTLKLYRNNFGTVPVAVSGEFGALDVAAAMTADRKAVTIGIVNPTEQRQELRLDLKSASLAGSGGRVWTIAGPDPLSFNEPGKEPPVKLESKALAGVPEKLEAGPYSVSLYKLAVR